MKKFILFLMLTVSIMACSIDDVYREPDIEQFKLTTEFIVPIQEGHNTVVTYNDEIIYDGNVSVTIDVPKYSQITTRSSPGLDWHFVPNNTQDGTWHYQITRSGILMFEDIPSGDNDYNDFICFMKDQYQVNVDGFTGLIRTDIGTGLEISNLEIYPKAMGNSIPLSFGVEIIRIDNKEIIDDIIIYNDIRKEAFDNAKGFINTSLDAKPFELYNRNTSVFGGGKSKRYYPENLGKNNFGINYYIIANGTKYYTANSTIPQLTKNKTPYGLFIPNVNSLNYPLEGIPIWKAYPSFRDWVNGENLNPFNAQNSEHIYKMP